MSRLEVGATAPDFSLPAADGSTVSLSELRTSAENGVIVYFYPAAGTPGCTKQACDFRGSLASLTSAGYAVVGISPDGVDKLAKFTADRSEEHTSELQSRGHLVCRLLLEKKNWKLTETICDMPEHSFAK